MTRLPATTDAVPSKHQRVGVVRFSNSLQSSNKGEVMLVDANGGVMTWWDRTRLGIGQGAKMGVCVGLPLGVVCAVLPPASALVVAGTTYAAMLGFLLRVRRLATGVLRPVQQGRPQDALREAQAALQQPLLLRGQRILFHSTAAASCFHLGLHAQALQHAEDGLRLTGTARRHGASRTLLQALRGRALVELGRLDEADTVLQTLRACPPGELFQLNLADLELRLAFERKSTDGVTGDLYDTARTVLGCNRFGTVAGLLAWAFHANGDKDMAHLMLEEAFKRLGVEHIAEGRPSLFQWMTEHAGLWGIEMSTAEETP